MPVKRQLSRLCIHESVGNEFPTESSHACFDDLSIPVEVVGDEATFNDGDAVASFRPRSAFLEAS
jgi:D-2-hydroxyacid dehydrogenase (NADP+)